MPYAHPGEVAKQLPRGDLRVPFRPGVPFEVAADGPVQVQLPLLQQPAHRGRR